MKSGPLTYILILISLFCQAQSISPQLTNSTGGTAAVSDFTYEWSVGEMSLIESMISSQGIVTNGFLQSLEPLFILTPRLIVEAPNLLTPDGDGINDAWVIKDLNRYSGNDLRIVDRGGRTVYHVKNYQNDWVGNLNGLPLAKDTYFYILLLTKNGQTAIQRGFISIIR